jgi:hypothetical protein
MTRDAAERSDPITPERLEAEGFRLLKRFYCSYGIELNPYNWLEVTFYDGEIDIAINDGAEDRVRLSRKFETMPELLNLIAVLKGSK